MLFVSCLDAENIILSDDGISKPISWDNKNWTGSVSSSSWQLFDYCFCLLFFGVGRSFKIVLSNFHPKQVNKWIGGPRASLFQLFIAFQTWPNLTCLNRPLSQFFYHLTPPGWPLIWQFFSEFQKMDMERRGGQIIELFLTFLTWPNLTFWRIPLIPSFITKHLLMGSQYEFSKEQFLTYFWLWVCFVCLSCS